MDRRAEVWYTLAPMDNQVALWYTRARVHIYSGAGARDYTILSLPSINCNKEIYLPETIYTGLQHDRMNTSALTTELLKGYNHLLEIIMKKFIEYKSANDAGIVEVVANKGICWQVRDDEGNLFLVQKKHVVRGPWEETEEEEASAPAPLLTAALAQVQAQPAVSKAKAKKEKEPAVERTNLVTLKQLCFDLNVIPRIARRRLRKALGQVGTGSRWEWAKDSAELETVKKALTAPVAEAAE